MKNTPPYRWQNLLAFISITTLYALLAKVVLHFLSLDGVVSIVWPSSGLALAALLIGGIRFWPAIFAGALIGNILAGSSVGISLGISVGNTLEAVTAALLLKRTRFNATLSRPRDYLWLALAGAAGCLISALNGNFVLLFNGILLQQAFFGSLWNWWQGDFIGILVLTPMILIWRFSAIKQSNSTQIAEALVCFSLAFLAGQATFHQWFVSYLGGHLQTYWILLFAAWASVRFGRHGAALMIAMIASQALLGVMHMDSVLTLSTMQDSLLNSWLFILVATVISFSLALILFEHKQTETELRESEASFRAIIEQSNVPFALCDNEQCISFLNRAFIQTFGYQLSDIPNLQLWLEKAYPDEDYRQWLIVEWQARMEKSRQQQQEFEPLEVKIRCQNGKSRTVITSASQLKPKNGYLISLFDVSDIKEAEETLRLAAMVYENIGEAVMVTNEKNQIIDINPAFTAVTGYSADEAIGQHPRFLSSNKHDPHFHQTMKRDLETTGQWQGEIWNKRKNGEVFPEWQTIKSTYNSDGSLYRRIALFSDISKKKKSEQLIWQQANFDALTGLPNRRMFLNRLEHEISLSHRSGTQMALLFIDLDRFKDVNDTLGHSVGDTLLKAASQRLSSCVRESDTAARFGGDEFTLLLNHLEASPAIEKTTQKILDTLSEPFLLENEIIHISSSIGIAVYPEDGDDAEDLMKKADQAMYHAKANGRNRCCYFTTAMQEAAHKRIQLTNDLRTAIKEQQFLVYYQPIVDLRSGKINKAEALLRWPHPSQGFVGPDQFIPIAEHTGLITDIGNWIFTQVTRQISSWRDQLNSDIQISINKSPVEFVNDLNGDHCWADALSKQGLPGDCVVVEITEGLLLDPADHIITQFNKLRDAGIGVSLDDFGTGYSSLAYLKKFDIDFIKIDKTFIRNLSPDSEDMALCEAIIVMAHKLGLKVIAEGVETQAQHDLLVAADCDYGQGYLFSKAVPADEFELLISQVPHMNPVSTLEDAYVRQKPSISRYPH